MITGDTLFSGAVGRPDLPAHFGGSACGAGLSGKPSSTIGFERRFKPGDSDRILEFNRGNLQG